MASLIGEANPNYKHGGTGTRLYHIWLHMKDRCYNPNAADYRWYGEKGVTICPQWKQNFVAFRSWSFAHGYQSGLSIDRYPNNDGPYSPTNCRWVTLSEQAKGSRAMRGKKHSTKTRRKMSLAHQGKRNSSYGSVWIRNDGLRVSNRIPQSSLQAYLRRGWVVGRRFYR